MMPAPPIVGGFAVALLLSSLGWANARQQDPAAAAPPPPAQQQPDQQPPAAVEHPSQASLPGPNEATGAAPLRVMVGKSLLINTSERLKRVSVTDPAVADIAHQQRSPEASEGGWRHHHTPGRIQGTG